MESQPLLEIQEIILLALGLIIMITAVIVAIKIPEPTAFQIWVFRLLFSLGAADLGSIIPGFINFEWAVGELIIRAGGAIALFLVAYLVNPPKNVLASLKAK